MKALGFSLFSASVILAVLFAPSNQNCASQETGAGMRIQGRPLASWVADVNIERGLLDSDPALDVLVSAGPTVLTNLAEILQRDLSTTQEAKAADVIGVIAYRYPGAPEIPDVVPALASGAEKKEVRVRQVAVQALGAVGRAGSNAIPVLCRCTKDEDERVRMCAIEALGRIGIPTPQALEALHGSLSDPNGTAQIFAVQALYKFGKPTTNAVPLLIPLTMNTDVGVRCLAIQILGQVGTNHSEAVGALKSALNDESELFVRPLAREALKKLEAKTE
jgi:HEAT repeat protein